MASLTRLIFYHPDTKEILHRNVLPHHSSRRVGHIHDVDRRWQEDWHTGDRVQQDWLLRENACGGGWRSGWRAHKVRRCWLRKPAIPGCYPHRDGHSYPCPGMLMAEYCLHCECTQLFSQCIGAFGSSFALQNLTLAPLNILIHTPCEMGRIQGVPKKF